MERKKDKDLRDIVRKSYGQTANGKPEQGGCCSGNESEGFGKEVSRSIGYSDEDTTGIPQEADMGLGCGNPQLIAGIEEGEVVVDLGSGGGIDCFLAAKKVGDLGKVIGVDMTPEMVSKARKLADRNGYQNVDFRLGEIENLPVADGTADVIISNCVINLSPKKQRVYDEAYRVLKKGGRLALSDVVLFQELTEEMKQDERLYCG